MKGHAARARAMRTGMMRMGAGIGQASTFLPVKTRGSELGPVFLLRCCCRTHSNVPKSALTFHWRRRVVRATRGEGGGDTLLPPSLSCRNRAAAAPIFQAAFLPRAQFDLNLATMLDAAFIAAIGIAQRIKATNIERGTRFSADFGGHSAWQPRSRGSASSSKWYRSFSDSDHFCNVISY